MLHAGRAEDRVNRRRLGPKDLFGYQADISPDRLTKPLVRCGGELVETDWCTAAAALKESFACDGRPGVDRRR